MKAKYNKKLSIHYFDSAGALSGTLTATITGPTGNVTDSLTFTAVSSAPNLHISSLFTLTTTDQYEVVFKDGSTVVLQDTIEVGTDPVSDFPYNTEVDLVLDDALVGGTGQTITLMAVDSAGETAGAATFAKFTGSAAITTIALDNGNNLVINIGTSGTSVGNKTATFLAGPAFRYFPPGDTPFITGTSNTTFDYQVNSDGITRSVSLDGTASGVENYVIALNNQLIGLRASRVDSNGSYSASGDRIKLMTDRRGLSAKLVLSNLGSNTTTILGISAVTVYADTSNVANADAVTFAEIKAVIEGAVKSSTAGDILEVTQDSTTSKLILTAKDGSAGTASRIDLVSGTASLITSLGLSDLGSQGSSIAVAGSNGTTFPAIYSTDKSGYVVSDYTFSVEGSYFLAWHKAGVLSVVESILILKESGKQKVVITALTQEGSGGTPHTGALFTLCTSTGALEDKATIDSDGAASLLATPATYTGSLTKSGVVYSSNNYEVDVIDTSTEVGNNNFILVTESFTPTTSDPAAPSSMCSLYADIFRMDGKPLFNADVMVSLIHRPQSFSGNIVFDTSTSFMTDSNGHVEFDLVQGIQVEISISPLSLRRIITVPSGDDAASPVNLMTLLASANDLFDIIIPNIPAAPRRTL